MKIKKMPNKKKIIEINWIVACYECPFKIFEGVSKVHCQKKLEQDGRFYGQLIPDPHTIPDWCPLEDYKNEKDPRI